MNNKTDFVSVPFFFAGIEEKILTIFAPHVLRRREERFGTRFNSAEDCASAIGKILSDPRLEIILEKVPIYSRLRLYLERYNMYIFLQMGTRIEANEVKVSTLYCRGENQERVLVEQNDLCYVLPSDGKLRFGKEKKYFEIKKKKRC